MSLATPTTSEISAIIIAQLESSIGQTIPILPRAFSRVLAKVLAGVFVLIYKYAGFSFLQMFVAHASNRETVVNGKTVIPLQMWGALIGEGLPSAAVRAEIVVALTVTNQVGSLAAGKQLLRSETGIVYTTVAAVLLDAPTVQVTIRAASDQEGGDGSGEIGNLVAGDLVSFANPQANVATDATVVSVAVAGADAEETEVYRTRIRRRFQARPQGGAYADYRIWGEEVSGIVAIYPYRGDPGEVDVYVEANTDLDPDGIPTQDQLDAVAAAIELDVSGIASRRPANAAVNVLPITRTAFDVEITGLIPDTTDTRDAILEGLIEHLLSRAPFIVGLSVLPRDDRVTQAAVSGIVEGIVDAEGASVTAVTIDPGPSYTLGEGELAKLDTVTYVP